MMILTVTYLFIKIYCFLWELSGAAGEDWTPDLTLTKGALYHWATAAAFHSGDLDPNRKLSKSKLDQYDMIM